MSTPSPDPAPHHERAAGAGAHPNHPNVAALPVVIHGVAFALGFLLEWVLGGHIAPGSSVRLLLGWVALLAGLGLGAWFGAAFRRSGENPMPNTPSATIIATGPYRFSRNPAYVSFALFQAGLALVFDTPWLLVTLAPAVLTIHFGVILREERYLERTFGEEYLRYKTRVRRWL